MLIIEYAPHLSNHGKEVSVRVLDDAGIDYSSLEAFYETYEGDDYIAYEKEEEQHENT